MTPPPTFEQARADEEANALLAHLPFARPLLGAPVVPLRWSHELELALAGNALFVGLAPLRGDFMQMLWRLHPWFITGDGRHPNLAPGAPRPSALARFGARWRLWRLCSHLDVHAAETITRAWLASQRQDAPGSAGDNAPASSLVERVNQFDAITLHFSQTCGYRPAEILELGVAWTWQQLRADDLSSGNLERRARWVRPSAALVRFEA